MIGPFQASRMGFSLGLKLFQKLKSSSASGLLVSRLSMKARMAASV